MTAKNIDTFILVGICSLYIIPRVIGTINVVNCINNAPWDAVVYANPNKLDVVPKNFHIPNSIPPILLIIIEEVVVAIADTDFAVVVLVLVNWDCNDGGIVSMLLLSSLLSIVIDDDDGIDDCDDDDDDDDGCEDDDNDCDNGCDFSNVLPPINNPMNATTLTAAFTSKTDGGCELSLFKVNAPCKTGELVENKNVIKPIVNNPFFCFCF